MWLPLLIPAALFLASCGRSGLSVNINKPQEKPDEPEMPPEPAHSPCENQASFYVGESKRLDLDKNGNALKGNKYKPRVDKAGNVIFGVYDSAGPDNLIYGRSFTDDTLAIVNQSNTSTINFSPDFAISSGLAVFRGYSSQTLPPPQNHQGNYAYSFLENSLELLLSEDGPDFSLPYGYNGALADLGSQGFAFYHYIGNAEPKTLDYVVDRIGPQLSSEGRTSLTEMLQGFIPPELQVPQTSYHLNPMSSNGQYLVVEAQDPILKSVVYLLQLEHGEDGKVRVIEARKVPASLKEKSTQYTVNNQGKVVFVSEENGKDKLNIWDPDSNLISEIPYEGDFKNILLPSLSDSGELLAYCAATFLSTPQSFIDTSHVMVRALESGKDIFVGEEGSCSSYLSSPGVDEFGNKRYYLTYLKGPIPEGIFDAKEVWGREVFQCIH